MAKEQEQNSEELEISDPKYLKHYTTLDKLLLILKSGNLRLGPTDKWKDKNDKAAVDAYCKITNKEQIKVLCFAQGDEMIHHWNTYAQGCGCRLNFRTNDLLEKIKNIKGLRSGHIKYLNYDELKNKLPKINTNTLPFIKRKIYQCEQEFRIIWTGAHNENAPEIPLLDCLDSITLSPELPKGLFKQEQIKGVKKEIKVYHSTVLDYPAWKNQFDAYAKN